MKIIRIHEFGDPSVMKLEEVPDPVPGNNQVVVRVKAIGVNPVDTYIRAGKYGPRPFPYTPGADAAGVVESVGAGVTSCKIDDRVYVAGPLSGAYAEKVLCEERHVHLLPAFVSYSQGAAIGVPYGTAYCALVMRAVPHAGETVLVHGGSGGVGTAAIQIARALGLTVFATAGSPAGLELVQRLGAHRVFDHKTDGYQKQIMEATGGQGLPIILEMAAHINLGNDLKLLAKGGRVIVIGSRGPVEITPRDLMASQGAIHGLAMINPNEGDLKIIHAALGAGLENRTLSPVIGKELPLIDAAKAHEAVLADGAHGKIVLLP